MIYENREEGMNLRKAALLIAAIALSLVPGIVGSIFTAPAIPAWYAGLVKPAFNPPNWVFGPVWTLLYVLMGVALFLVIKGGFTDRRVKVAAGVFIVQLVLNGLWSYVFFGLAAPGWALIEIAALWVSIVLCLILFYRISAAAGGLLIPYLAWVTFAAVLNGSIWVLNR
jgi:benzodiazapine receptor